MSKQVITAIRGNFDRLRRAGMFEKPAIAENILEGILSLITDFENRLSELEKEDE